MRVSHEAFLDLTYLVTEANLARRTGDDQRRVALLNRANALVETHELQKFVGIHMVLYDGSHLIRLGGAVGLEISYTIEQHWVVFK